MLICCTNVLVQVLLNTAPISFTASCTAVTQTQVGQSVIPPGTTLPPNATPPQQVKKVLALAVAPCSRMRLFRPSCAVVIQGKLAERPRAEHLHASFWGR